MKIKKNLADALIYLGAYIGGAVFALVGGFLFFKSKDENIRKPIRIALILFIVFLCTEAISFILDNLFNALDEWYVMYWVNFSLGIVKVIVFGFMALSAFLNNNGEFYELNVFSGDK